MVRVAKLGSLELPLASWLPPLEQYSRRYLPVDPESETVSGDEPGLLAEPAFRVFRTRSWRGGEGITWWEPDRSEYRQSTNVRPVSIRDGLVLGARQIITPDAAAATFNDGSRFGYGLGKLWTGDDGDGYPWDATNGEWDATISTGAGASDVTSLTDGDDTFMYSGHETKTIWRWKSGTLTNHYTAAAGDPFVFSPVVRSFEGRLFALDGDDLYQIDKTTADTRTQRGDPSEGSSAVYLAATPWCYGRMSLSDRGPIWLQRLDNGQCFLWLYDVHDDAQDKLGKIANDFVFPYSLFFSHGFAFATFRYAPAHAESGDAYLWFKRGAQDGYAGPFRSTTGVTASKPILIAGVIGDDLIVYFDGAVWAYNLTDGALYQMATQTTTGTPEDATTLGKDIFITPVTSGANAAAVERFNTLQYTTEDASIDLGKHDFDYPGLVKVLLDVTVVTDPLPAATQLQVAVSADGKAFTTLSTTASTDGTTRHRFVASASSGTAVAGVEFELRLIPDTTDVDATVTVREVSARATGGQSVLEIVARVDLGKSRVESAKNLTALNALAAPAAPAVYAWTDPYQLGEKETPSAFDVRLKEVVGPRAHDDEASEELFATVRLMGVDLV